MLPRAYPVLERLLQAIGMLVESRPDLMRSFRLHFVGTGKSPNDPQGHNIRPYVERFGLSDWVSEHPQRIGYTDVLNHLLHASAILILGSTEAHYAPSKVFQAVQSGRPVLALLHEKSTAASMLEKAGAGTVIGLTEECLPAARAVADTLVRIISSGRARPAPEIAKLSEFSARDSARRLAAALDRAA
jgi:hypothetical protein